jgi:drug/metabolite transporter, DME family
LSEPQAPGDRSQLRGQSLVLAAAVLWGTTGTAQAFAPAGAQPAGIGALRLALGGAALLALAFARGAFKRGGRWPLATLLAAGGMAAYQLCFFAGVSRTGVAVGTIVAIGSAPILAGLLGWLLRHERPGPRWGVATALAVLGCTVLIAGGGRVHLNPIGIVLALGAGAAYALYAVSSKELVERHDPEATVAVVFCLAALFLAPILFVTDLGWLAQPRGWAVILHLGLIATATAYVLFARGLALIPVGTAVTLSLAEPLTAALLGVVVLGERLTLPALAGVALIFAGLVCLFAPLRLARPAPAVTR